MTLGPLGNAEIAVMGKLSQLWQYRQGIFGWNAEQVAPHLEYKPWITRSANGTEIAVNVGGWIYVYVNTDGSPTWNLENPSSNRAYQGMPIIRTANGSEIAANVFDGSLDLFSNADGSPTWDMTQAAGPGAVSGAPFTSFPAIVRYPGHRPGDLGGTSIAAVGPP